jgi:hypothetical protein
MVDKHLKLKSVATALFRFEKIQDADKSFLNDETLGEFEAKVAVAESNIIGVIGFDFDVEIPNQSLYRLADLHFKETPEVLVLAKVLQLDLFRVGASLFYPSCVTSLASLLLANYLLTSGVTRKPDAWHDDRRAGGGGCVRRHAGQKRRYPREPRNQYRRPPPRLHVRPPRLRPALRPPV